MNNLVLMTKLTPIKNEQFITYKWDETKVVINLNKIVMAFKPEEIGHVVITMVGGAQIIVDAALEDLLT